MSQTTSQASDRDTFASDVSAAVRADYSLVEEQDGEDEEHGLDDDENMHSGVFVPPTAATSRHSSLSSRHDGPPALPPIPYATAFKQQRLTAYFPQITTVYTVSVLAAVCAVFAVVGAVFIIESDRVMTYTFRYDHINNYRFVSKPDNASSTSSSNNISSNHRINMGLVKHTIQDYFNGTHNVTIESAQGSKVRLLLEIPVTIPRPIVISYRIDNMFQNHRRYRDSRSMLQIRGEKKEKDSLVYCIPFRSPGENGGHTNKHRPILLDDDKLAVTYNEMVYSPCGLGPWSMFNDTFVLTYLGTMSATENYQLPTSVLDSLLTSTSSGSSLPATARLFCNTSDFDAKGNRLTMNQTMNPCKKQGVAWPIDSEKKYGPNYDLPTTWSFDRHTRVSSNDPYFNNGWYADEVGHPLPNAQDEDLMVWMRSAQLPNFRKVLRIVDDEPLHAGRYILEVDEFWDSASFRGTKSLELTHHSWIGGNNYVLGYAYLTCACAAFVLSVAFTLRQLSRPKRAEQALHGEPYTP